MLIYPFSLISLYLTDHGEFVAFTFVPCPLPASSRAAGLGGRWNLGRIRRIFGFAVVYYLIIIYSWEWEWGRGSIFAICAQGVKAKKVSSSLCRRPWSRGLALFCCAAAAAGRGHLQSTFFCLCPVLADRSPPYPLRPLQPFTLYVYSICIYYVYYTINVCVNVSASILVQFQQKQAVFIFIHKFTPKGLKTNLGRPSPLTHLARSHRAIREENHKPTIRRWVYQPPISHDQPAGLAGRGWPYSTIASPLQRKGFFSFTFVPKS